MNNFGGKKVPRNSKFRPGLSTTDLVTTTRAIEGLGFERLLWTDFCGKRRMSTFYLLQSAGPAHHRLALEQLLLAQLPNLAPQPLPVFATATEPPAGEKAFFWRPAGRSWLLEAPRLPTAFEARLTAERTDLFPRQQEEETTRKLGAAPALPSVGRLYSLQTEADAQLLLRVYHYALQPAAATPSELLAFLPLGLLKGAWVWGKVMDMNAGG